MYPCGSISFTLKRRRLVLVPSLFRSSAVVNVHFFVSKLGKRVELVILGIFELEIVYSLNFLPDNHRFKTGVHVKAVSSNAKSLCLFHQPLYGGFV